jgi:hypothetical protein
VMIECPQSGGKKSLFSDVHKKEQRSGRENRGDPIEAPDGAAGGIIEGKQTFNRAEEWEETGKVRMPVTLSKGSRFNELAKAAHGCSTHVLRIFNYWRSILKDSLFLFSYERGRRLSFHGTGNLTLKYPLPEL